MESMDTFAADSTESETDSRITDVKSLRNQIQNQNQNQKQNLQMSNRSSVQTTFMNHEKQRSISSNPDNNSNSVNTVSRSNFSSNEDGPNMPKRPNNQEVHDEIVHTFNSHVILSIYFQNV